MTDTLTQLVESVGSLTEATTVIDQPGRMRVRLIEGDRWGSSGYYANDVLERDGAAAFPEGTQMYLDHPTITEDSERPERSVRDLAARLTEDAHFDGDGLYADVEVFPHWRPLVEGLRDAIGLSIRAGGRIEEGEAPDGRNGRIVTALAESNGSHSVDFVTRAGAGGRVMDLLESARAVELHEGHGMTANDLRDALNHAVSEEHGGPDIYVWVRDYSDDFVIFDRDANGDSGTYRQTYTVADGQVSLTGDRVEGQMHTEFRPFSDGSQSTTESTTPPEGRMAQDPNTDQLRESVTALQGQVTELQETVTTITAERDQAVQERNQLRARDAARASIAETLATTDLPDPSRIRVTEAVVANLPLTEAGELDTAALTAAVTTAATAEAEYRASLLEAAGVGRPSGVGSGGNNGDKPPSTPEDYQARGLSESAARVLSNR